MVKVRSRGEAIRGFILENVEKHPSDIATRTAIKFGISRQAVRKHLQRLLSEQCLSAEGKTRKRIYRLQRDVHWEKTYHLENEQAEDLVWRKDIAPILGELPDNVLDIWHYGFTEMFNNIIDHSEGMLAIATLKKSATLSEITLYDDGVGIFRKIQKSLGLDDERHAVLELAKGKFTTEPERHTGEGIFFTSRMFDDFRILSGSVFFSHAFADLEDYILQGTEGPGTMVTMLLNNHTARTTKEVFNKFSSDDYGFTRTVVPVRLAEYGDDKLVSRSQAKRLMARVDRFKTVFLNFEGVESIGQAFADEVFRVFRLKNPEVELIEVNANEAVQQMIKRANA